MATYEALYVRTDDVPRLTAWLEQELSRAWRGYQLNTMPGNPWAQILGLDFDSLEDAAIAASRDLDTEAIAFAAQTSVDAWIYVHAVGGTLRRAFDFGAVGEERTWNRIEGDPEPWEAGFWSDLRVGETEPFLGTLEVMAIGDALGLPGFSQRTGWNPTIEVKRPGLLRRLLGLFR